MNKKELKIKALLRATKLLDLKEKFLDNYIHILVCIKHIILKLYHYLSVK